MYVTKFESLRARNRSDNKIIHLKSDHNHFLFVYFNVSKNCLFRPILFFMFRIFGPAFTSHTKSNINVLIDSGTRGVWFCFVVLIMPQTKTMVSFSAYLFEVPFGREYWISIHYSVSLKFWHLILCLCCCSKNRYEMRSGGAQIFGF